MGFSQSRPKSLQQKITYEEAKLKFSCLNVLKIKQAFGSSIDRKSVVNFRNIRNELSAVGIHYTLEEEKMVKKFLSSFVDYEEEGASYYNLKKLLVSMYLLSNDTQQNKASALFDLYSNEGTLSRDQLEEALHEIVEIVGVCTKNLLKANQTPIQLQESVSKDKAKALMPQVVTWFCSGVGLFTKQSFLEKVKKTSKSRRAIDLTNPQSIRNAFMSFIPRTREVEIELQSISLKSSGSSLISSRVPSLNSLKPTFETM